MDQFRQFFNTYFQPQFNKLKALLTALFVVLQRLVVQLRQRLRQFFSRARVRISRRLSLKKSGQQLSLPWQEASSSRCLFKKYLQNCFFKQIKLKQKWQKLEQKINSSAFNDGAFLEFIKKIINSLSNRLSQAGAKLATGVKTHLAGCQSRLQGHKPHTDPSPNKLSQLRQLQFKSPKQVIKNCGQHLRRNKALYLSLVFSFVILGSAWFVYDFVFKDLPSAMELSQKKQIVTTRILDRNGRLLYRIYQDENRTIIPLSEIPQHMINATLAIEDKNFYQHHGFSLPGIFRALVKNVKTDQLQGGSTITQQLVKNRLLNNKRTIRRKVRELLLSVLVETVYSKEEILQMYLNEVPYGGSTYGIEEAAWRYFGKPAKDLTLAESSMLAGLPAAPSVYTPFGPNPELSERRQEEVLRRMVEDNYITIDDAYHARQEQLQLRQDLVDIKAPHFVMYVKQTLAEQYGEDRLTQGGLEVRTSLDLNLQRQAEDIIHQELATLQTLNVSNAAALVTNPQTGEVLAMIGSKDYFDFAHDGQVNVTLRPRQPGSSIKPLTYALAFEQGQAPWSKIRDAKITYRIPGSEPYTPRNYDGEFHGTVTLRRALANSYNIPAVKTLVKIGANPNIQAEADHITQGPNQAVAVANHFQSNAAAGTQYSHLAVQRLVEKGQQLGIDTWNDSSRFGLSLTLGAGEVRMVDLAEVYGTFATGGHTVELDPFLEIKDYKGNLLYRNQCLQQPELCQQNQTLDPLAAYRITSVLKDNRARSAAFGSRSVLYIPGHETAVKTGTSNNLRDNWTIGYTTDRLVGVWVGNNDNSQMSQVASGITGASPIWNQIIRLTLDENNPHQFQLPPDYIRVKICAPTGTLPCRGCPNITEEVFVKGEQPTKACDYRYFLQKKESEQDKQDGNPPPPGERPQIL